ncbi:tRNA (guanine-N7-)-methyltransferase [Fodinibius salinus]|uniref:tRNA (guanine-N(7)-)-methyltransferase n=1 Tax=Fodinibius salinus TaxID=860790 RepID=A0A5D3YHQ8_9BACT|nr:tRNA (guanosine(46)-N7)-methyltransferase TrmB [Fodinibius salinus]TYP92749.1 tRNA (guanine-N7-)-methyltransferase [Fodinibius salinus]
MGVNKKQRFEEVASFDHVSELTDFQDEKSEKPRGRWNKDIFGNSNPNIVELACGKGTYTLELARRNPQKNYIGIDIKGARIWKGATCARDKQLENVHFLRIYIDHLHEYFGPAEIDDLWITFPDPYPKGSDRNKRLTSPKFLRIYQKVLHPEGKVRLKTDSDKLFSFTQQVITDTSCEQIDIVEDIYRQKSNNKLLTIQTDYEKEHLAKGRTISFISFSLPDDPI